MLKLWYSAGLWLVIEVEGEGALHLMRSVVVFRAKDFDDAERRALALGLEMEASYLNHLGEEVRWRLKQVETVDQLGWWIRNGREVYSEPFEVPPEKAIAFGTPFDPLAERPTQTGI